LPGVLPICHELPRNGVVHTFVKVHIKQFGPNLDGLGEMRYGEAFIHGDFVHPSLSFKSWLTSYFFLFGTLKIKSQVVFGLQAMESPKTKFCNCCQW
jgi:hypothetical protein